MNRTGQQIMTLELNEYTIRLLLAYLEKDQAGMALVVDQVANEPGAVMWDVLTDLMAGTLAGLVAADPADTETPFESSKTRISAGLRSLLGRV